MGQSNSTISFDLGCPQGGNFWICTNKEPRFIGCCRSNPCETDSGICPIKDLEPSSFNGDAADHIPEQACVNNSSQVKWYACEKTNPPFLGCCASDACLDGKCDGVSLRAARLNDDHNKPGLSLQYGNVSIVLPATLTAVTTTMTVTSTDAARFSASNHDGGLGLSINGLIALTGSLITLSGVITLSIVGVFIWRCIRKRGTQDLSELDEGMASPQMASPQMAQESPRETSSPQVRPGSQPKRQRILGEATYSGTFEDEWGYPER